MSAYALTVGSNTAADHGNVLGRAVAQIPEQHRYGVPILVTSDSSGSSYEFLAHVRGLRLPTRGTPNQR